MQELTKFFSVYLFLHLSRFLRSGSPLLNILCHPEEQLLKLKGKMWIKRFNAPYPNPATLCGMQVTVTEMKIS